MTPKQIGELTPKEKRIKIAEACGAKWEHRCENNCFVCDDSIYGVEGPNGIFILTCLPEYLIDLNAMNEAEKTLSERQREIFPHALRAVVFDQIEDWEHPDEEQYMGFIECSAGSTFDLMHATAAQRADALLLTVA